jgi:cysteine desulfurase
MADAVYLDHNATTPLGAAARAAMARAMEGTGNASSVHGFGRAQRKIVEDAREAVGALCGAKPANVIFTSGGSEANNTVLRGIKAEHVLVSAIEHPSVLDAHPDAVRVPVGAYGAVDVDALEMLLQEIDSTVLVSVMAANNETGVIQPLDRVAEIVRAHNAKLHVDAVQAAGKIDIRPVMALADVISISAHKMNGPIGAGAIVVKDGVPFEPLIRGGGQERRRRAGTENVIAIAGFGAAAADAQSGLDAYANIARLRDHVEAALADTAKVYGAGASRLVNTLCVGMPGVAAETQVMSFDLAGLAVSAGSACSSGKVEPSHVLLAMGATADEAAEAVRISFGLGNTEADAARVIDAWQMLYKRHAEAAA